MLKTEYIFLDENLSSKEEALDFVSTKALELGLTDDKDGLLEDFKKREEEFSTGLQDGFAIPHAKSDYANKVAIIYVRNNNSLEWETFDDKPVDNFFALIVPKANAGNEHLLMISKLATSLLEDDFKQTVKSETDKAKLKDYILKVMKEDE